MRRGVLLIGGLCAAFCVMWLFCEQLVLSYNRTNPVLVFAPAEQTKPAQSLDFPFEIPGTTLIAEQIVAYDGLFSEGESSYDVTNAASLLLYNYGQEGIAECEISLSAGAEELVFHADTIPAGARILVPEKNAKEFSLQEFSSCSGMQKEEPEWDSEGKVEIICPQFGEVIVKNLTDDTITGICLYYKTYYADSDFYVGGNTYTCSVERLGPNEYIQIYPNNYALGYSRIVRISIKNQ